jgi:tryptophan halogenase
LSKNIKSITIVGGGSSGWMTAAAICKQLPFVKVNLVESPDISTVGVGESTIGHINEFFRMLDLKDEDWMKYCNATYKTSIKFIDFKENPDLTEDPIKFHYPFGRFDLSDKPRGLMEWFIKKAHEKDLLTNNFAEFFHDSILMTDRNKLTKNENGKIRGFDFEADTAYHLDATLLGFYLRDKICIPAGLNHILEEVKEIKKNENGEISNIITDKGTELISDLYIDCTGFKSLLLEQTMNVKFKSFHDTLLNDRAIATVLPYIDKDKEMENYTSCTAIESGWVWNIPLWNRIGTGYVYSSKHSSEEQALKDFKKHLISNRMICSDKKRLEQTEFRYINIKHGVHEKAWEKNVIGIGLANGFIEPLESTGLMLTHEAIIKMIKTLAMRDGKINRYDIDMFNFALGQQVEGFKDFISQHYALTLRDDTPYWKEVSETIYSQDMNNLKTSLFDSAIRMSDALHKNSAFNEHMSGIIYIAAGMGYNPVNLPKIKHLNKMYNEPDDLHEEVYKEWEIHKDEILKYLESIQSHYGYLKENIYK